MKNTNKKPGFVVIIVVDTHQEEDDFDAWAEERAREYEEERDAIACLSSF